MNLTPIFESLRIWFRRITENYGITGTIFLLSFIFAGLLAYHVLPVFRPEVLPEKNLAGEWEICVPASADPSGCMWTQVHVPADIPKDLMREFHGWAIYRTKFTAPEKCLLPETACNFYFQEVGDAVEAHLNGQMIGRHGQFPPNAVYAKHYPARFSVSRDQLRPGELANELVLTAYSLKQVQAGVRAPPIGIYTPENAFLLYQTATILNVVIPILCFVGLFMIAMLSFAVVSPEQTRDPKFTTFVRFCFASACFLLSISEVPRV